MRAAVIANGNDADWGYVGDRLVDHGFELELVVREEPQRLHDAVGEPDLLLLLGSDWSVHDPALGDEVEAEAALVRQAVERGTPVLAICYGAQLSARAFGCQVTRAERPEVGWRTITSEDENLCPSGPWFQLHFDRWWDSGPVRSFAANDDAPQAFRLGRLLAVQFHPEVTPVTAARWLREGRFDGATVERELERFSEDALRRAHLLVDKYLAIADATISATGGDRWP